MANDIPEPGGRFQCYYTAVRIPSAYADLFPSTPNILNSLVEEKVDQMTLKPDPLRKYPKNTVAWIRISKHGEWMLAIAQDNAWHYMLATNDRITGSISPLSAPRDVIVIPRPGDASVPDVLDDWWMGADGTIPAGIIHTWLTENGYGDQANMSSSINVNIPWEARFKKTGGQQETINFNNLQKAEIIAAVEERSK